MSAPPKVRLDFLDGIRGWAAICIIAAHTADGFLRLPLSSNFANLIGNVSLWTFFVLSAMALSAKFFRKHETEAFSRVLVRRYLRLTIPIFLTSIIAYLLMKWNLFYHLQAGGITQSSWVTRFYKFDPSLETLLNFSFYGVYFGGVESYNTNLWTMPYELFGSVMVYALLDLFSHSFVRRGWIYIAVLTFMVWQQVFWYMFFIGGLLLMELWHRDWFQRFRESQLSLPVSLSLMTCIYLFTDEMNKLFHGAAAILGTGFVLAVMMNTYVSGFFSNRLARYLGHISFSLYLFHLFVICSITSYLFLDFYDDKVITPMEYGWLIGVTYAVSLLAATLFAPIENASVRWSHHLSNRIFKNYKSGSNPGAAISKPENSNAGATVQPTNV